MSEEILKALMQLFAIITKQDDGVSEAERAYVVSFLKSQLNEKQVDYYYQQYEDYISGKDDKSKIRRRKKLLESDDSNERLVQLLSDPILKFEDKNAQ